MGHYDIDIDERRLVSYIKMVVFEENSIGDSDTTTLGEFNHIPIELIPSKGETLTINLHKLPNGEQFDEDYVMVDSQLVTNVHKWVDVNDYLITMIVYVTVLKR